MKYLTRDAARLFLNSSRNAYLLDLISWSQLMDRLVALRGMCSTSNTSGMKAGRILQIEEWENGDEWEYEGDALSNRHSDEENPTAFGSGLDFFPDEDDDTTFLCFFAGSETGLSNWEFHPYDNDFFPSIPHGHWNGKKQPKLDPYQGWVYQGSKQQRREPKKNIITLWNDREFREFAQAAIDYYLEHHPHYNGWRVTNPRHLPRRR
jgi:hypothetical protein